MTKASIEPKAKMSVWGWRVLVGLGALLVINGAWLFFAVSGGGVFESDTGVSMTEVQEAYPTVVETMNRRGSILGLLVAGLGIVLLVDGLAGLRTRSRRAWSAALAITVVLGAVGSYVVSSGNLQVGIVYLVFAAIGLVGLTLASRGSGA